MIRRLTRLLLGLVLLLSLGSCTRFIEGYRQAADDYWNRKAIIDAYERKYSTTTTCRPGIFTPNTLYCTTY